MDASLTAVASSGNRYFLSCSDKSSFDRIPVKLTAFVRELTFGNGLIWSTAGWRCVEAILQSGGGAHPHQPSKKLGCHFLEATTLAVSGPLICTGRAE